MKRYTKTIDGKQVIKPANKIIINKDGMTTYNPTEEMILEDGWVKYVTPEISEEEKLRQSLDRKIREILDYDSSDEVNAFYIGDYKVWLDKATRVGLRLRFDAEISIGKTLTILWFEGMSFEFELNKAVEMLNIIELYASACYDNTQKHIANVKKLSYEDSIAHYDYRKDYPEKIVFNL